VTDDKETPHVNTKDAGIRNMNSTNLKRKIPSWKTARPRNCLSAPAKWLFDNGFIPMFQHYAMLDFGCGRGTDADILSIDRYDPYWHPTHLEPEQYDIILCTYVLCVLNKTKRKQVLDKITNYLAPNGVAYISVRRDVKKTIRRNGYSQWKVVLDYPLLYENSSFCIYQMRKISDNA